MSLVEKYRPQSFKDFLKPLDFDKKLTKILQCMSQRIPILLAGKSGIGKTTLVYVIARDQGYTVYETNASDERKQENLKQILKRVQMYTFVKTLFLFDEIDGLNWSKTKSIMIQILKKSIHPIFMTANEIYKIPEIIKKSCQVIPLTEPKLTDIAQRIKEISEKEHITPRYGTISTDVRNTLLKTFYGGEVYQKESQFEKVKQIFLKQTENITKEDIIWMIDNSVRFFSGRSLIEFIELITKADIYGLELLKEREKGNFSTCTYPFYLRRLSVIRKGEKIKNKF